MSDNSIKQSRVVSTIIFIFSVIFISYILMYYTNTKKDIDFFKQNIENSIGSLYKEVSFSMFERVLKDRSILMIEQFDSKKKKEAIRYKDRVVIKKLFEAEYNNLKRGIIGFNIMHFYDKNGISILRMHDINRYGDDLKVSRDSIPFIIKNKKQSSFYDVSMHGLAYRYVTPIYDGGELIGFLELGIKPTIILEKVKKIFGLKGYVFVENRFIPSGIRNNIIDINNKYSICQIDKDDKFIQIIKSINIENQKKVNISQKSYNIIKKDIFGLEDKKIGSIIFFQDITEITNRMYYFLIKSIIIFLIFLFLSNIALSRYIEQIFKKLTRAKFLLNNTTDAIYVISAKDGSIVDVNKRALLMLGFTKEEFIGKNIEDFRTSIQKDELFDWQRHLSILKQKKSMTLRSNHIRKDGTTFPVEASLSYINDKNEDYIIAIARDITNTIELEKKFQKESNAVKQLQDVISKSVIYTTSDLKGNITSVSKAFEEFSGYSASEIIGKNHSILKNPKTPKKFYQDMWEKLLNNETFIGELLTNTKDDKEQWIKLKITPIFDNGETKVGYSSYRENITDKKELEYISIHDTLTGIYNREYFQKELQKKINSAIRYNQSFGFVMLDIDHFKNINDTYGHAEGDKVLQRLTQAIKAQIRKDDTFARWGGEEFIIITNGATIDSLKELIKRLQNELSKTNFDPAPNITLSFGLTLFKNDDNTQTLPKRADDALYEAKKNGRDRYEIIL